MHDVAGQEFCNCCEQLEYHDEHITLSRLDKNKNLQTHRWRLTGESFGAISSILL